MRKKPVDIWYDILKNAQTYEEWEEAAFQLDVLLGNDLWYAPTRASFEKGYLPTVVLTAMEQASKPNVEILRLPPHPRSPSIDHNCTRRG